MTRNSPKGPNPKRTATTTSGQQHVFGRCLGRGRSTRLGAGSARGCTGDGKRDTNGETGVPMQERHTGRWNPMEFHGSLNSFGCPLWHGIHVESVLVPCVFDRISICRARRLHSVVVLLLQGTLAVLPCCNSCDRGIKRMARWGLH